MSYSRFQVHSHRSKEGMGTAEIRINRSHLLPKLLALLTFLMFALVACVYAAVGFCVVLLILAIVAFPLENGAHFES